MIVWKKTENISLWIIKPAGQRPKAEIQKSITAINWIVIPFSCRKTVIQVDDYGYLIYYYPEHVEENGTVIFNVEPIKLKIDPDRARKTLRDAIKLLNSPIPPHHSECEYCIWGRNNGD